MFQVKVFWVVTPCSVVVGYQCLRGPCCLHLQGEVAGQDGRKQHRYKPRLERGNRCHYPIGSMEEVIQQPVL